MGDGIKGFFETIATWIGGTAILGLIAYFLFWVGPTVTWYAAEYKVSTDAVHVAPKPTDCDFFHAPVGFKDCHYEKWVAAKMAAGSKGCDAKPDNKGWAVCEVSEPDRNAKYDSVYVSWEKKSD
jgi:hypothetical protein